MSEIKTCTCKHAFQDKEHGPNQRVHNKTTKGLRCSVCGNEKVSASSGKK